MSQPVVGLQNAPVTKLLLGSIVLNTAIASVLDIGDLLALDIVQDLWHTRQFWKLGLWQLLYNTKAEVFFGITALYKLAETERFMGSSKYATFILMALSTTNILVPAMIGLVARPFSGRSNYLACGMTPTIFAILFQYHALIPSASILSTTSNTQAHRQIAENQVWKGFVTDKVWMYALAAQLATCRYPTSVISAATGWFVGSLYYYGILPKGWRIPSRLLPFIETRPISTTVRERSSQPEFRTRRVDASESPRNHAQVTAATVPTPSDADVESIMGMMNVTREVAVDAIVAAGGSLEAAIDNLLSRP